MKRDMFSEGARPSLEEVLNTREKRVAFQNTLTKKYPGQTVIAFKLNIPGPVKNNELIEMIFRIGAEDLKEELRTHEIGILYEKTVSLSTGPEAFYVADHHPDDLKKHMIRLEDESMIGRLYDLDIFSFQNGEIITVSRTELGYEERKCLLCSLSSKVCGRNRTHSISEMHEEILSLLQNEPRLR